MSVRVYLPTQKPTAQHNSQQVAGRLQRRIPEMSPHHSPEVPRRHVMHVIMFLGMLTCGAAVPRADVVCRPDPTILWLPRSDYLSGCPRVPWQMAAASDPKVRGDPLRPNPVPRYSRPVSDGPHMAVAFAHVLQVVARYPNPVLVNVGANKGSEASPNRHPSNR